MNATGHSFVVAVFNNKNYLIDPAFEQFYYNDDKYDDMVVNGIRVKSKSPFHYGFNINKDVINNLISKGYMELTDYNAFVYANSFYKTITGSDYDTQSFIEGDILLNVF